MAFWDFLRPITQYAVEIDFATRVIVFLLSLGILAVAVLAYRRNKSATTTPSEGGPTAG